MVTDKSHKPKTRTQDIIYTLMCYVASVVIGILIAQLH